MEQLHRSTGLPQLKPRKTSFNAVLAAHSKSRSDQAVQRAKDILSFMELLAETDPSVAPDSASYNTVMNCYARSSQADPVVAAQQADAFLRHVVDVYKKNNNSDNNSESNNNIQPDTILFNTAMGLWAKTGRPGSFRRARSILDRQMDLAQTCDTAEPDVFGVTSVISSCAAETQDRQRAWDVALSTYRQLHNDKMKNVYSDCRANHVTYGTMIKACGRLLPFSRRKKWLLSVFADAVAAGCVGDMVVSKLREAAPANLYRELMQGNSKRNLPAEWTANVREQSEYRTTQKKNKGNKGSSRKHRKRAEV